MTTETIGTDSAHVTELPSASDEACSLPPLRDAVLDAYRAGQIKGLEAWHALLTRLDEVEAIPSTGMPEDEYDQLVDLAGDLAIALMSMPAPDAKALMWKLDSVLAKGNWYSADNLRQTVEDYRRMLCGAGVDTEIESAWSLRTETFLRYKDLPLIDPPEGETETPEEQACWVIIDEADEVIRTNVARTPRGAFIQVKLALFRSIDDRGDEDAFIRGDMTALEGMDRGVPLMLAALRSLETQGGIGDPANVTGDKTRFQMVECGGTRQTSELQLEWEMAVTRFTEAQRADLEFHASHVRPVLDKYNEGSASIEQAHAAERDHEPFANAYANAVAALMITPAPTPEALKFKLNTGQCDAFFDGSETSDNALISITSDVHRLLGDGRSAP